MSSETPGSTWCAIGLTSISGSDRFVADKSPHLGGFEL